MAVASSEGFYMTLPSNGSYELFKSNTVGCYTVDLAQAIELNGQWLVGLCEKSYPRTWCSLKADHAYISVEKTIQELQPVTIEKFNRKDAFCWRPKELSEDVLPRLLKHDPSASIFFDDVSKCFRFNGSGEYRIRAHAPLCYVPGLKREEWWTLSKRFAPYPADLNAGLYNLYVYTDIIQYQAVGDSYSPLLGVVQVNGTFGETVNVRYNKVHYVPLARNYIKNVGIEIKSDRDHCVDLSCGKVIVKLHFKPLIAPL